MQGHEGMDRTSLDSASVVGHLVDPGRTFAFLAAHRGELFPMPARAALTEHRSGVPAGPTRCTPPDRGEQHAAEHATGQHMQDFSDFRAECGLGGTLMAAITSGELVRRFTTTAGAADDTTVNTTVG
ncbi:MAG: hypothetical protein WCG47_07955, partial [Dermatophilaceae bacterium]